jgi:hypothetical protein
MIGCADSVVDASPTNVCFCIGSAKGPTTALGQKETTSSVLTKHDEGHSLGAQRITERKRNSAGRDPALSSGGQMMAQLPAMGDGCHHRFSLLLPEARGDRDTPYLF